MNKMLVTSLLVLLGFKLKCYYCADWNYDFNDLTYGPLHWENDNALCAGDTQSPINIDYNTPLNGWSTNYGNNLLSNYNISNIGGNTGRNYTFLNEWNWYGKFIHHFKVLNNGHSIKLSAVDAKGNHLIQNTNTIAKLTNMFGQVEDDSPAEFCLDSLHFHWGEYNTEGSEHTQYGKHYPLEVHFVHYNCDYNNLTEAIQGYLNLELNDQYFLAVVGFLFEVDDDASDEETNVFSQILQEIDDIHDERAEITVPNLNLVGNLIPEDMQHIANKEYDMINLDTSTLWYYEGSLTTPPCLPVVRWHVFDYKLKITNDILNGFRNINGTHGKQTHNWRPVQDNINNVYKFEFNNDNDDDSDDDDNNAANNESSDDDDEDEDDGRDTELTVIVILAILLLVAIVALIYQTKCQNNKDEVKFDRIRTKSAAGTADETNSINKV